MNRERQWGVRTTGARRGPNTGKRPVLKATVELVEGLGDQPTQAPTERLVSLHGPRSPAGDLSIVVVVAGTEEHAMVAAEQ